MLKITKMSRPTSFTHFFTLDVHAFIEADELFVRKHRRRRCQTHLGAKWTYACLRRSPKLSFSGNTLYFMLSSIHSLCSSRSFSGNCAATSTLSLGSFAVSYSSPEVEVVHGI